jgi:predicted RNA-binding protein YlxR (DUF448 family)
MFAGWAYTVSHNASPVAFLKRFLQNFHIIIVIKEATTINRQCFILQDPTNLQTKVQKHQNFEAEIEANKNRIDTIQTSGEQLLAEEHYASDTIR